MKKILTEWKKFVENESNRDFHLYYGSKKELEPGTRVRRPEPRNNIIEQIFEKVRPPDKPSRLKSIFLCPNTGSPGFCSGGGFRKHIYEVIVRNPEKVHKANSELWTMAVEIMDPERNNYSKEKRVERVEELAENYWNNNSNMIIPEVLVEGGEVIIKEKVK